MTVLRMLPYDMQLANERRFNRKHIDKYIRQTIEENPRTMARVQDGIKRVHDWMSQPFYASKQARIDQLKGLDIEALVMDLFVGIAYVQREELFTSVSAQLAGRLGFSDKAESIQTVAELLAVLCYTDAFDICKASRSASLVIVSRIELSERLEGFIADSQYLPPMVCPPETLTNNHSSGYLTHNDSLILGKGNHHDGDLCLDVLNTQNSVALQLSVEFLCTVEEQPTFELDSAEKVDQWGEYKRQSYQLYHLLVTQGNKFWLTHKPDKRGRIYAQGYHITTQGSSFKKASIELAHEEVVEGVPGR
jgi:hypothetical protein